MSQMFNNKELWRTTLEAEVADYRSKWEVIFPKEDSYPSENEEIKTKEEFELIHRNERTEHKFIPEKENKDRLPGQFGYVETKTSMEIYKKKNGPEIEKNWVVHEQRAVPHHTGNVYITTEQIQMN